MNKAFEIAKKYPGAALSQVGLAFIYASGLFGWAQNLSGGLFLTGVFIIVSAVAWGIACSKQNETNTGW